MTQQMHWVPSVIASSTCVGLSAVGLSLGRPEHPQQPRPASSQKEQERSTTLRAPQSPLSQSLVIADGIDASVMPSRTRVASHPLSSPLGIHNLATEEQGLNGSSPADRASYDGRTWTGKVRRLTSGDAAQQRRSDHERSSTSGSDAMPQHELRPRRPAAARSSSRHSWIKRLSTLSTTSQDDSRESSSRPPSVSLTSASATLSNTGSTIPILGPASASAAPPLPPNKLVKRTSSQRLMRGDGSGRVPTLRRPATSHQRSATLEHWSRAQERESMSVTPELMPRSRKGTKVENKWKPFFAVKVNKKGTFSRSTDAPADARGIKRIIPDTGYYPTLLSAKSVVTSTLDVDDFPEYDDDSVFFSSRPASAFGFDALLSRRSADIPRSDPVASPTQLQNESEPRRSFSFLSRKPSSRGSIKGTANKLTRRISRRVVSEPTVAAGKHQTNVSSTRSESPLDANPLEHGPEVINNLEANTPSGTAPRMEFTSSSLPTSSHTIDDLPNATQQSTFLGSSKLASLSHSPALRSLRSRVSYQSTAPSDTASSAAESDTEARLMADTDVGNSAHMNNAMSSITRSRASRPSHSRRGSEPRFETIIDESPPKPVKSPLKELLPVGMRVKDDESTWRETDIIEEEASNFGSPVRTIRSDKADNGSPFASRLIGRSQLPNSILIPSSPPDFAKPLNLGTLEYDDPVVDEDEESRWSAFDDQELAEQSEDDWAGAEQIATPLPIRRSSPFQIQVSGSSRSGSTYDSALNSSESNLRTDIKGTLFAYTEKQIEKASADRSPPRPSTVHGKKDADGRGSRANNRRPPGQFHIRSQSVPVVPDVQGKRQTVITNKFGTWGVGSKGVTEDWNDDFDFGDNVPTAAAANGHEEKRMDSMQPMAIPEKIKEHQLSVMNNISLVREFGIMVEQLKSLRPRAIALGLVDKATDDLYDLVDSMIELADQEADASKKRPTPPSSPGIDLSGFDDIPSERPTRLVARNVSVSETHDTVIRTPPANKIKRKTVLPDENDVFTSPATQIDSRQATPVISEPITRPRKDSEAMARSVIEALKTKKSVAEGSIALEPIPSSRRVQFDTRTLRHIVPYVSSLVRRVKDQIREAERLGMDSESDWDADIEEPRDPPLAHVFRDPSPIPESPSSRKSKVLRTARTNSKDNSPTMDDVNKQLKMMKVM